MTDDAEVVRDEDVRQRELVLQVVEQVDDLRLDRHVERRDRLVGDDQARVERERARDADALPLAAGELVRVAVVVLGREPDDVHQLLHAPLGARSRDWPWMHERVGDDRADALARVERRVRILEDHLHLAPQRAQRAPDELRDVAAVEQDACPSVSSCSRTRQRPSVDLPQPDSPTRPRVSPARTSSETLVDGLDARRPRAAARRCP